MSKTFNSMCDFKYDIVSRCLVAYQKTKNHLHLPTSTWDVWHPSIEQPFFLLHHTLRDFPIFSFSSHLIFWRAGLDLWPPFPNAPFTSQPSDTWHRSPAIPHQLLLTDVTLTTLLLNSVFLQLHLIFHPLTTSSMKGIWDTSDPDFPPIQIDICFFSGFCNLLVITLALNMRVPDLSVSGCHPHSPLGHIIGIHGFS